MWPAPLRLGFLWIAHVTRVLADNCLRIYTALSLARLSQAQTQSAWHLATFLLMVPAVFLAPLNGALCNSLPKTWVLAGSNFFCLLAVAIFGGLSGASPQLPLCWALVALTAAVNGPVRYAFLPAAAIDTRWPLTRINGFFEMGSAAAIVAGLVLGAAATPPNYPEPIALVAVFVGFALVASFWVRFTHDTRRPEAPAKAIAGFFADCRRIWNVKIMRGCLLGLASLRGLLTAMVGALIAASLGENRFSLEQLLAIGGWIMAGVAVGSLLAGLQRHPRRVLGLVPWGATGLTVGLIVAACGAIPGNALCLLLGVMAGLVNVPLAATYQGELPADARGNGMAVRNFADYLVTALAAGLFLRWAVGPVGPHRRQLWLIAGFAALLTLLSWRLLLGPVFEQILEFVIWPIYRIKGFGPGLVTIPAQGPLLVVANHTAWMDPVWTGKVIPRRLVGLLTSVFFDLPVLRWVLTHLAETIRVEFTSFRREVPELKKAIAVLDRGDCVLIFPEGTAQKGRKPAQAIRPGSLAHLERAAPRSRRRCLDRGGLGVLLFLFQRPPHQEQTFRFLASYSRGRRRPHAGSPRSPGRPSHHAQYLMQRCLEARRFLGLEVPVMEKPRDEDGVEKVV